VLGGKGERLLAEGSDLTDKFISITSKHQEKKYLLL
jgi:hypothetical protein